MNKGRRKKKLHFNDVKQIYEDRQMNNEFFVSTGKYCEHFIFR